MEGRRGTAKNSFLAAFDSIGVNPPRDVGSPGVVELPGFAADALEHLHPVGKNFVNFFGRNFFDVGGIFKSFFGNRFFIFGHSCHLIL